MGVVYDILIKGGFLVDGTGMPWVKRDVAIARGRIAKVGHIPRARAERVIDARGKYVTPGFIDIHTHSDIGILLDPTCECAVRQGVTTHVIGNCGDSPAPVSDKHRDLAERRFAYYAKGQRWKWSTFKEYLSFVETQGVGINIAALVGHGSVRMAAMGFEERPPTPAEMREMKGYVAEAMRAGAFGMSTGLVYPPGCYASTDEIVELAKIVARHKGFYASHIRGERETIVEAVRECIEIGERAGCPVQISHNNPKYGGWGKSKDIQALWEAARDRGIDVTVDNDIHTDFGPALSHALPQWIQKLGTEDLIRVLTDKGKREELKAEIMEDKRPAFGPSGLLVHERFDRIWLLRCPRNKGLEGKTVAQVAEERRTDAWSVFFDVIAEERDEAVGIFDYQDIEEIKSTIRHPLVMICSDGWVLPKEGPAVTPPPYVPCSYGEYPGVLERFVFKEKVMRLEEAIRKMTSMPSARLGLQDRGIVRKGFAADITIFDLPRVRDKASNLFPHLDPHQNYPHQYPEGVDYVIVNGGLAIDEGRCVGTRAGKVLRQS